MKPTASNHTAEDLIEIAAPLQNDIKNPEAAIDRVFAQLGGGVHNDPSFIAYCALGGFGPRNDWNGLRSAAKRISEKWEATVLKPAIVAKQVALGRIPAGATVIF
jgi:hypothetical protein